MLLCIIVEIEMCFSTFSSILLVLALLLHSLAVGCSLSITSVNLLSNAFRSKKRIKRKDPILIFTSTISVKMQ